MSGGTVSDGHAGGSANELGIPGLADVQRCGVGSSATVYRATDVRHGRAVAVKVLNAARVGADAEPALERELAAMGRLSTHPNIIDLYGSGTTADRHPYIVMPHYSRGNYADRVDETGPMPWDEVVDFGVKIAAALHTAHTRGFVHRDVKPANIFRGEFDRQPILADFGIASFATPSVGGSFTVKVSTTPLYGAPEVLEGERPTERSDIYSLGASLYALLEGVPAFADPSTEVVVHRVTAAKAPPRPSTPGPAELVDLIGEMMGRDPDDRPATALDVARRLVAIQKAHGLDPTPIITDDAVDWTIDAAAGRLAADDAVAGDVDAGDDVAPPVVEREPRAGVDPPPSPPVAMVAKPVIEPIDPSTGYPAVGSTRPVGSLERPTEPVAEPPSPPRFSRIGQPVARPSLRWALLAAVVFVVAALVYTTFTGSGPNPGELTGREIDDAAASAVRAAWAEAGARQPTLDWSAHPDSWVTDLEFSPDGSTLATAGTDGAVRVWARSATEQSLDVFELSDWPIALDGSPTFDRLVIGVTDGDVALAEIGGRIETLRSTGVESVEAVAWDPGGERLLVGRAGGRVTVGPAATEVGPATEITLEGHDGDVLDLAWSDDGARAVSSAKDGSVIVWDLEAGGTATVIDNSGDRWTRSVEWITATLFLTTGEDGTVTLRSSVPGDEAVEELSRMNIGSTVLASDLWLDDSVLLAAGYEDGSVRVWDLVNGDEVVELAPPTGDDATTVRWARDGTALAAGRLDGSVQVWSLGE